MEEESLEKLKYLIALHQFPKFGPARLRKIRNYFPDFKTAWQAQTTELEQSGIEEKVALEFSLVRREIEVEKIISELIKEEVKVISLGDKKYPGLLAEIYDPPPLIYYKGKLPQDDYNLAIVGTRKLSTYGKQVTEQLSSELARQGLAIVSGLALGIDALAHQAALNVGGKTVAVLASGLDKNNIYPATNRWLADKIIAGGGTLITEFPLGTPPLKHHFPQRNRIISGMSRAVLIIEAGKKSGALITGRFALEQDREVFCVPGNIYSPVSIGPNNLIKLGAKLVTNTRDILEALDLLLITNYSDNKKIIPETAAEAKIISSLTREPIHVDELIRHTNLTVSEINSTLVMMEMKGLVKNLGGMQYILNK